MLNLFPPITPFKTEKLKVSDIHTLYVEQCGNPNGIPMVFLHGGPGGGINEDYRRYFDPEKFRVILFDQRGCGRSEPFAEIEENTTWDLVNDIEKIRTYLNIEKWAVFGGSWGSTLALAYAETFPESVMSLFLRGIFLLRPKELHWFYQEGASKIFPEAWEDFLAVIPEEEQGDLMAAYYKRLTSENEEEKFKAARAWSMWEGRTSKLLPDPSSDEHFGNQRFALAFARIECHYFMNKGFFTKENSILSQVEKIKKIPTLIIQGRYDVVCPAETAWELHKSLPLSQFIIVDNAGHSLKEEGITQAFLKALKDFAEKKI